MHRGQWADYITDARCVMLLSLTVAVAFAVGHDRFYHSLDNHDVSTFDQRLSTSIGTAFTFIIKFALVLAVTTVYAQQLWKILLSKTLPISTIDTISGSTLIFRPHVSIRYPLLILLILVTWGISVATIFPPGSLAVELLYKNETSVGSRALFDWNSQYSVFSNGQSSLSQTSNGTVLQSLITPFAAANELTALTAALGEIPTLPQFFTNTTYDMSFYGPMLECSTKQWHASYWLQCNQAHADPPQTYLCYASWLSWPNKNDASYFGIVDDSIPIVLEQGSSRLNCSAMDRSLSTDTSTLSGNPRLYIATNGVNARQENDSIWNITTCQVANASYSVTFDFHNNIQSVRTSYKDVTSFNATEYLAARSFNPQYGGANGSGFNVVLDYYASMALIDRLSFGYIGFSFGDFRRLPILNSRLGLSDELRLMLPTDYAGDSGRLFDETPTGQTLASMLEDLSRNVTVTMMTSPFLTGVQDVTITAFGPYNVYRYSWQHLWLPYGIAIAVTALVVILGLVRVINAAPYSTKFSTFLRTTPWEKVGHHDSGADPLPSSLAAVEIALGSASSVSLKRRTTIRTITDSDRPLISESG
ncbi:hypothetical protein AMS68_001759 [Peltaster fructicola]|uniref:Uncharacterized protein n=1 Tax=Peltaster fructicola TaxID=286661 RepID=A0A6H0XNA9_9PEZI|nr:hypothetical protein AMS68_001759 [Peltaster fructicola]